MTYVLLEISFKFYSKKIILKIIPIKKWLAKTLLVLKFKLFKFVIQSTFNLLHLKVYRRAFIIFLPPV